MSVSTGYKACSFILIKDKCDCISLTLDEVLFLVPSEVVSNNNLKDCNGLEGLRTFWPLQLP